MKEAISATHIGGMEKTGYIQTTRTGFAYPAKGARGYGDAVQVAHARDTSGMQPMRTRVQAVFVQEDICVAKGATLANPQLGSGGEIQYFIGNGDKPKLTTGPIVKFPE